MAVAGHPEGRRRSRNGASGGAGFGGHSGVPEEGNPRNRIAPDVLVAFGVGTHSRSSYLVWEEGKPPDWVLEVASPSTAAKDLDFKRRAYAAMGVPEYWLFDPKGDVFPAGQPQLQGLALSDGGYARLAPRLVDGVTMIRSGVLGAGSACGRRVHPHARSGDPGGHPASERVEGARRAGDSAPEGCRDTCRAGGSVAQERRDTCRAGGCAAQRRRSPRRTGSRACAAGKQRNARSRRLASRSWRPHFSVLKCALLSLLRSALSGVCGQVRATTSLEILRASTVERWRSPSSPPRAPDNAHGRWRKVGERPCYAMAGGPRIKTSHTRSRTGRVPWPARRSRQPLLALNATPLYGTRFSRRLACVGWGRSSNHMARVNIDGKDYDLQAGQNLLHACLSERLDLPYFCWHPAMGSVGSCRLCAIIDYADEADQRGRLQMACTMPVRDGMRISIGAAFAADFRKQVIEWLMQNHPHDCPVCEEGGECHLQDMTRDDRALHARYAGLKRTWQNQYLGPFVGHEMNRCITCYRCVRYYRDYAGGTDLDAFGSRSRMFFGRQEDGVLESEFAGNLVEVCPTGVFTDKPFSQAYSRKWDLQSAPSVCPNCAVGLQYLPRRTLWPAEACPQPLSRPIERLFPLRSRALRFALCEPREAHSPCWRARRRWRLRSTRRDAVLEAVVARSDTELIGIGSPRGISRSQLRVAAVGGCGQLLPWFRRSRSSGGARGPRRLPRRGLPHSLARGNRAGRCGAGARPGHRQYRTAHRAGGTPGDPRSHLRHGRERGHPGVAGRWRAGATASRPRARSSLPPWPRRASMSWPRGPAMARRRGWRGSASISPLPSRPSLAAQTISRTPQHRHLLAPNARW